MSLNPTTFDVVADFNNTGSQPETGNPFTYGTEQTLNGPFTLFTNFGNANSTNGAQTSDGSVDDYYGDGNFVGPCTAAVITGDTLTFGSGSNIVIPDNVLAVEPGNSVLNVTRFTAPSTGLFSIAGDFSDVQRSSVDLLILVNGVTEFNNTSFTGSSYHQTSVPFSINNVSLLQGEAIDFVINSLGDQNFDMVGLQAQIMVASSPPPPPPPPPPAGPPPSGTTANMIMRDGSSGDYEIYNLGNNAILAAGYLGQVGTEWQVAGVGSFDGTDTSDMILRDANNGAFEIYDISNNSITNFAAMGQAGIEWSVAGFGDFSGRSSETDMLIRNSVNGVFLIYDISNNAITASFDIGHVGTEWTVVGIGDFSSRSNEADVLMRDSYTGQLEIYDISNNEIISAQAAGQVGLEWSVVGCGDFSGNPNETDMLMRNGHSGQFEIYDIANNAITSAASMGQVGIEWQIAGFGPINGAGASDMLMRDVNNGAFEVFDVANNRLTAATSMGQVGTEWSVAGIAADPPDSANTRLAPAMASYASASGELGMVALSVPAIAQTFTPSPIVTSFGPVTGNPPAAVLAA